MRIILKILITALVVTGVSELGKRFSWIAAILASLPLTSILAMVWLYLDTRDVEKVSALSTGILWAVLPSLLFFAILPLLLRSGIRFAPAMLFSCVIMAGGYWAYARLLQKLGISLS